MNKIKRMPRRKETDLFKMSLGLAGVAIALPIGVAALQSISANS